MKMLKVIFGLVILDKVYQDIIQQLELQKNIIEILRILVFRKGQVSSYWLQVSPQDFGTSSIGPAVQGMGYMLAKHIVGRHRICFYSYILSTTKIVNYHFFCQYIISVHYYLQNQCNRLKQLITYKVFFYRLSASFQNGNTAIHLAAGNGHWDTVDILLRYLCKYFTQGRTYVKSPIIINKITLLQIKIND